MARRRREVSDDERRQAIEDYRVEVQRFQWEAYRNVRWAVAGACIFLGLIGFRSMFDSREDLAANILMVVGAVAGVVSFWVKDWRLLAPAFAVAVAGFVWVLL
ncbi:hypothetical protein AB0J82_20895 [Asanoa sp. NPDC049518]|uniref:hypothetical protein n=1 Tax=unclassified Asanoa TaxID=2685164 RepID=UPI00343BCAFE